MTIYKPMLAHDDVYWMPSDDSSEHSPAHDRKEDQVVGCVVFQRTYQPSGRVYQHEDEE